MILFEMHFSDSFRFHIFLLSCMSTDYWVVKGVPKNSDRNLAKNLITQRHEKKILKVCLLALIWRFFWTGFFSLNSKFKTLRFSLQFQCLFGHPVVYPENIAWQTRSKTFTKTPIFFQILVERPSQSHACTLHPLGYASPQHSLIKQSNPGHWTPRQSLF